MKKFMLEKNDKLIIQKLLMDEFNLRWNGRRNGWALNESHLGRWGSEAKRPPWNSMYKRQLHRNNERIKEIIKTIRNFNNSMR